MVEKSASTFSYNISNNNSDSPVEVSVVVKPVRQRALIVKGETLVEAMEGNVFKGVVVECQLQGSVKGSVKHIHMGFHFQVAS